MDYSTIRVNLISKKAVKQSVIAEKEKLSKQLQELTDDLEIQRETLRLAQEAAQLTLENISIRINNIVTSAIKAVLPEPYEFFLDFNIKRGIISSEMYVSRGDEVFDLRHQNGDGLVSIVALALRVAVLCLDKRHLRRALLMDEPCGEVSVEYQPLVGQLIEYLSKKLNIQIIMIAAHGSNMDFQNATIFRSEDFAPNAVLG